MRTKYRLCQVIGVTLLAAVICFNPNSTTFAQKSQTLPREGEHLGPTNCELTVLELDRVAQVLSEGVVIAIARLGDGERSKELTRRRLFNIRAYLTRFLTTHRLSEQQVITAEGERTRGPGRVELYLGGKLHHILAVPRNGDLVVGYCDGTKDTRFYPWRRGPANR